MDEDVVPVGQNVQVIDPDVRAYVYSLVTAVSILFCVHWFGADIL